VPAPFVERLRDAGARVAIVCPGEPGAAEQLLAPFDGLVLVGGGDVEPARYGQAPGPVVYGVEPDRDELEVELLHAADRTALPTLCICRGMQVMNVAFGGTLHQHLPAVPGLLEHGAPMADTRTMHDVKVAPESLLAAATGVEVMGCSSHHHQGIDRLGEGIVATGWTDDGLVEAIERDRTADTNEDDRWMVGVQWHPEDASPQDAAQRALFETVVALASRRRGAAGEAGPVAPAR